MLLSHSRREVPTDSCYFRGEALARQRRRNIRAGSAVIGRFEPAANLVEQSAGPNSMIFRVWTVSGAACLSTEVLQWFRVEFDARAMRSSTRNLLGSACFDVQKGNALL